MKFFGCLGIEFIDENGGGPGVRLRNPAAAKDHKALGPFQLLTIVDLTTLTAYIGKWFSSGTKRRAGVPSTNEGSASNTPPAFLSSHTGETG